MIRANFNAYSSYVTDSLYQWDINQELAISGLNLTSAPEIHFTNDLMDRAIVKQSSLSKGIVTVRIPNSLLQKALTIKAYVGKYEVNTFKIVESIEIPIIPKARPLDYTIEDSDEEIYSFKSIENEITNFKKNIEDLSDVDLEIQSLVDQNKARIDNIIAHNNDTEGNSELLDIRVDNEGNTHESAGESVRYQTDKMSSKINAIEGEKSTVTQSVGKTYKNTVSYKTYDATAVRGACTSVKGVKFSKIKVRQNIKNDTSLTCTIYNKDLTSVYKTKTVDVRGRSGLQEIEFDFEEKLEINDTIYIDIQLPFNTDNTFTIVEDNFNYNIADLYNYPAYIYIKASRDRFPNQFRTMLIEFILGGRYTIPNLVITEENYSWLEKEEVDPISLPDFVFTSYNAINPKRNYSVDLYADHCFNTATMDNFKINGKDHFTIMSTMGKNPHTNANNTQTDNLVSQRVSKVFESDTSKMTYTTIQKSIKNDVQNGKKAFVLCIGDSQGMYGATKSANGDGTAFWGYVAQLFDMDKIDGATSNIVFIGSEHLNSWAGLAPNDIIYEYKGEKRTVHANAECIGSWSLNHFLHKATEYSFSGDKSKNEVYTGGDVGLINPFYDYSKVGESNIFSIKKWLERYRTLDDDGNRLEWGDPRIGTAISEAKLNTINVCTPTHIVLMHGRNIVVGPSEYGAVVEDFIARVKSELPNVKLGIALHPDMPGTYNPSNYENVIGSDEEKHIYNSGRANQYAIMRATYNQCVNRETDNIYIIPVWYCMPTMYSWVLEKIESGLSFEDFKNDFYCINGDNFHPSGVAQQSWAYQIYCWILYTMI